MKRNNKVVVREVEIPWVSEDKGRNHLRYERTCGV